MSVHETIKRIEELGSKGYIVSIVCGPSSILGNVYSVNVMNPRNGLEFDKPFAVLNFEDIKEVLDNEVGKLSSGMDEEACL